MSDFLPILHAGDTPPAAQLDLVASFLRSLSPATRRAYDGDLRDYATHAGTADVHLAVRTLLEHGAGAANLAALEYRSAMTARGLAATTVARRLAALRSMVRLARVTGRVTWSLEVRSPKTESYRDTSGPGDAGWTAMATCAREHVDVVRGSTVRDGMRSRKAARDLAIVRLLHDLGLRREEAVELDLDDVDVDGTRPTHVSILGKGRAERERLTLAPRTAAVLGAWITLRGDAAGPLFPPLDAATWAPSARLSGHSVARIVGQLGRDAGLSRPVRPHGLRHQAITSALDRTNGDVRRVQRFSRHKDVRILLTYDDRRRDDAVDISTLISLD